MPRTMTASDNESGCREQNKQLPGAKREAAGNNENDWMEREARKFRHPNLLRGENTGSPEKHRHRQSALNAMERIACIDEFHFLFHCPSSLAIPGLGF